MNMPQSKKKLLVLLGAGSSLAQGMPPTDDLTKKFCQWAKEWAADSNQKPDYYDLLWKNRTRYYVGALPLKKEHFQPNYEDILGDMHAFMNGVLPKPLGDPVLQWLLKADVFKDTGIRSESGEENRPHFYGVQDQLKYIFKNLAEHIRTLSLHFEKDADQSAPFRSYKTLFEKLAEKFELGIYNLNYDSVIQRARPELFTGFSPDGHFAPNQVWNRREWDFVYHLHGSVHYCLVQGNRNSHDPEHGFRILWKDDLNSNGWTDSADWLRTGTDNRRMIRSTIVAGRWKLDQIQEDPFLTFYGSLLRHAHEADAVLICGYGFGDEHVNNALSTMVYARRENRPPIVILDYQDPNACKPFASRLGRWQGQIAQALRVTPQYFRDLANRSEKNYLNLPQNIASNEFEDAVDPQTDAVDPQTPVAIWYGGVEKAANKLDDILCRLEKCEDKKCALPNSN